LLGADAAEPLPEPVEELDAVDLRFPSAQLLLYLVARVRVVKEVIRGRGSA